ncbi:MAG: MFS transporter, partial [Thermoanaerobaculia bacterium]|nr:MFS transporter [Thermoanaerobaculia bacterium]
MNERLRALERSLRLYLEPRQIVVFCLGMAQGAPVPLILGTLSFWLAREGVSKGTIGLFALATTPYALKFLWAPLIDRVRLPVL